MVAAIASFLDARINGGRWLVRIDDLDHARETPGGTEGILETLEAFDLEWDGPVLHQSSRHDYYREHAEALLSAGLAYRCSCTRRTLREQPAADYVGPRYPGTCRNGVTVQDAPTSVRARVDSARIVFDDIVQGPIDTDVAALAGDFVILRKEGFAAYHLATVLDDIDQGVTRIVRGADLLLSTPLQLYLMRLLGSVGIDSSSPAYAHVPVLLDRTRRKLSKQHGAAGINASQPRAVAGQALELLGCELPADLIGDEPASLWKWAAEHWEPAVLSGKREIVLAD